MAVPGATVGSGALLTPGGAQGPPGPAGGGGTTQTYNFYSSTPTTAGTGGPLMIGMEFTVNQPVTLTTLSFYKVATETGTSHTLGVWKNDGTLLGQVTTSGEAAGPIWITGTLSSGISLVTGQTYVMGAALNADFSYTSTFLPYTHGPINGVTGRYKMGPGFVLPDTTYNAWYGVDMTVTVTTGGGAAQIVWGETPSGTIDGTNKVYASAFAFASTKLAVFLNGLRQRRAQDYNETGSTTFSFLNAPLPGDSLSIDYIQP